MRTKVFVCVLAAAIFTACVSEEEQKQWDNENKIKRIFKEYVKSDFDNPEDFLEITKIDSNDTINARAISNALGTMDSIRWMLAEEQRSELRYLQHEFKSDSTIFVEHKLKVRIKGEDKKPFVKNYYILEESGEMGNVSEIQPSMYELPRQYMEAIDLIKEATYLMNSFNRAFY